MGVIEFTPEELSKEIEDLNFLRDALLAILNPEKAEQLNLPYTRDEYIILTKKMYLDFGQYPSEIITNIFKV